MIETVPTPEEQKAQRLDELYDRLSAFVCEHGPKILTRGMSALDANEAILECLGSLLSRVKLAEKMSKEAHEDKTRVLNKLQIANRIIDALPNYSAGISFLCEEDIKQLMEKFDAEEK